MTIDQLAWVAVGLLTFFTAIVLWGTTNLKDEGRANRMRSGQAKALPHGKGGSRQADKRITPDQAEKKD